MTTDTGTPAAPAAQAAPATPATGTPQAAPAAPAAPATPAPADIPTTPTPAPAASFEPTGDTGLDMALAFATKNGFGPDHAAIKQAQNGDFTALETLLAEKKVDGFEGHLKLAKEGLARITAQAKTAAEETKKTVSEVFGGEAEWTAARTWAGENGTQEEKAAFNAMFAAGGVQAKAAATFLRECYSQAVAPTKVVNPANPVKGEQQGSQMKNTALSPEEFRAEVAALTKQRGVHGFMNSPEYTQLRARRAAYR